MAFNIVAGVNNAAYGSVTGSGSYEENDQVTLEVTANSGYRFVSWDDSNTDNPRIFQATEDVTFIATLEAIPEYTVTVNINNDNLGSVTGAGTYQENASVTVTAAPVAHCAFSKFVIDNTDITTNPYTFTVTDNVLVSTEFVTLNWYTITVTSDDTDLGSVSGSGDYDEGDTVTLTAVPETDCRFTGWSDGNIENPRTFQASASLNLTAYFEAIDYKTFSLTVNDNTKGSVTGGSANRYEAGTQIELTAVPESGCKFVCWEINGEDIEYNNPLLFDVDDDTTIEAQFADIEYYTVNIFSTDADYGSVTIVSDIPPVNGKYQEESELTVTAVPSLTGKFLSWGDDFSKVPERTIYVDGNIFLRANFCSAEGPLLVSTNTFKKVWTTIKNFFSSSTGASKIGAPANNALGATTLADVVNSVGQPDGIAMLNNSGKVAAADIDGTLSNDTTGNAATASVADKVGTTTIGSSTEPVYINAGTPTACGGSLAVDITGNAATATSATACTGNAATVTVDNTTYDGNRPLAMPAIEGIDTVATVQKKILYSNNLYANPTTGVLTATGGIYSGNIHIKATGGNYNEGIRIHPSSSNSVAAIVFCGTDNTGDTGTSANTWELYTNGGRLGFYRNGSSTSASYYIQCATDGAWSMKGALTNSSGFVGNLTGDVTGNCSGSSGSCTGNAATATSATKVRQAITTVNNSRPILCAYIEGTSTTSDVTNAVLYANKCSLNPSTGILTATGFSGPLTGNVTGNCSGSSASCTGNAATATTATNSNNSKLTHTVGNTEYPLVFGSSFVITDAQQALRIGTPTATAANCALRCKAYCAAANTQGEAYLVCGNNIAKASANNARGSIYLYGTNAYNTRIVPSDTSASITVTLPAATGTLALTSSNITGSSASCTGNAATATTATNANNLKVTHTGAAWRDILSCATGFTSASNQAVYGHNSGSVAYYVDANATSGNQRAILRLGNATANTTAAGHNGQIYMYGTSTGYTCITPGYNSTSSITLTLPSATGTLALTSSNITGSSASCTGNANSATNIRVVKNSDSYMYNLIYTKGRDPDTNYTPLVSDTSSIMFQGTKNPSSASSTTKTYSYLCVGNSTACSNVAGRIGILRLFGQGNGFTDIYPGYAANSSIRLTLPASEGTIALTSSCDPAIKTDLQDVDCLDILKTLTVKRFKYSQKKIDEKQWKKDNPDKSLSEMPEFKDNEHEPWYIHTMAQEFNEAFDVDDGNPDEIKPINEIGVCLRAIQELAAQVDSLTNQVSELKSLLTS